MFSLQSLQGAGFSGINAGVELKQLGIPFTIIDKEKNIGGTWTKNKYPGCACDVPAHLYSFSFAPKSDWSQLYAPAAEIQQYLEDVVDKFGIRSHCRLGTSLISARWNKATNLWTVNTDKGPITANVVYSCIGALDQPTIPDFPGLSSFKGEQLHSAKWRESFDARGKTIAVVGSAASAVQLVPHLAQTAAKVIVFQRTPNYVVPRSNRRYSPLTKAIFKYIPGARMWYRSMIYCRLELIYLMLFRQADTFYSRLSLRGFGLQLQHKFGKEMGKKLTPSYTMGCKRILVHDEWYPTLKKPNVETVFSAVSRIEPDGVVAANDGAKYKCDTIVFATGFNPLSLYDLDIEGTDPHAMKDKSGNSLVTLNGISLPSLPNFFVMLGPNTGLGHNSVAWIIECQVNYTLQCIQAMLQKRLAAVEVKKKEAEAFQRWIDKAHVGKVWSSGCKSWYQSDKGRIYTLWPFSTYAYWWVVRKFDFSQYNVTPLVV